MFFRERKLVCAHSSQQKMKESVNIKTQLVKKATPGQACCLSSQNVLAPSESQ